MKAASQGQLSFYLNFTLFRLNSNFLLRHFPVWEDKEQSHKSKIHSNRPSEALAVLRNYYRSKSTGMHWLAFALPFQNHRKGSGASIVTLFLSYPYSF